MICFKPASNPPSLPVFSAVILLTVLILPLPLNAFSTEQELTLHSAYLRVTDDAGDKTSFLELEITIPEGFYQEMDSPFFSISLNMEGELRKTAGEITAGEIESADQEIYRQRKTLQGRVVLVVPLSGSADALSRLTEAVAEKAEAGEIVLEYQLCNNEGSCYYPQHIEVPFTDLRGQALPDDI